MTNGIIGFVARGAITGSRPPATRIGQTTREHCEKMAAQRRRMAAQVGGCGEAVGRT